ncbi:MAG: SatD family protein [bacterium]
MNKLELSKNYYLLLIDIKRSTKIFTSTRQKVFEMLDAKLKELNEKLTPVPAIKLSISYGDEIAGLFDSAGQIYEIVHELREAIHTNAQFRFVVSYGKTGAVSNDIRRIGGEIFKQADNLIKRLKKQDGFCIWSLGDLQQSDVLNSLTEMSNALLEHMTPYQRQVWNLLEHGMTQKQISEKLHKYPQSVSHALKRGHADLVLNAGRLINRILTQI